MSVVFAVHEPSRWDIRRRAMVPLDLTPAREHGELVIIFPGHDRPPEAQEAMPKLMASLSLYRPEDYLLLAGHMDLVIWASVLALRAAGTVQLLKWENRRMRYEVVSSPTGLMD